MRTSFAHPAERNRGCCLALSFPNMETVQAQSGVCTGAVQFDRDKGIALDGTNDYITYPPSIAQPFSSGFWSCVIEFTPNFTPGDGNTYSIYDTWGAPRNFVRYMPTGYIYGGYAGVPLFSTDTALTIANTKIGQRNVLVFCARSGSSTVWLNGVQIAADTVAFYPNTITGLYVGENIAGGGGLKFKGSIHSIKFFRHQSSAELLTAQEAADYYSKSTFQYRSRASVILPMGAEQHDVESNPTGVQLLTDGDMEAVGTAAWPAGGGAVVIKVAGARTGGTGVQVLRITKDAAATDWVSQDIWLPAVKYRVTGWARGDGIASYPTMGDNALTLWTGTTSATWQNFSLDVTSATGIGPYLNAIGGGAGGWVEFDDIVVERYWVRTLDTSGRGRNFLIGDRSTSTTFPTKLATRGYGFDGTADYLDAGDQFNIGTGDLSVACLVKQTAITVSIQGIVGKSFAGSKVGRWSVYTAGTTGYLTALVQGTAITNVTITDTIPFPLGQWNFICYSIQRSGLAYLWLNNRLVGSGSVAASSAENWVTTDPFRAGCYNVPTPGLFLTGQIAYLNIVPRYLTPLQVINENIVALRGLGRAG